MDSIIELAYLCVLKWKPCNIKYELNQVKAMLLQKQNKDGKEK